MLSPRERRWRLVGRILLTPLIFVILVVGLMPGDWIRAVVLHPLEVLIFLAHVLLVIVPIAIYGAILMWSWGKFDKVTEQNCPHATPCCDWCWAKNFGSRRERRPAPVGQPH